LRDQKYRMAQNRPVGSGHFAVRVSSLSPEFTIAIGALRGLDDMDRGPPLAGFPKPWSSGPVVSCCGAQKAQQTII
jgi:hypothetical protein